MPDLKIECVDCHDPFTFDEREQRFYTEKGLTRPPRRCHRCLQARRQARAQGLLGFEGPIRRASRPR
jgi:hypothetical protein